MGTLVFFLFIVACVCVLRAMPGVCARINAFFEDMEDE